ncbi:phosphate ABC transporter permease PstA [Geoalkalibacter subterraneus]|uniref:Phosphate transport system permease protein PstA n=1 Tax=Geoalkalibacter subterraneus TaxID=483547 RepID=A0A0B5FIN8_9BACT|nr:phosphate starvation-inducible protein PhoH [Geoalkalibacter subterraneus]
MKKFWRIGEPWVWVTGAALSTTLLICATLIIVVMVNGLGVFWPSQVVSLQLTDGRQVAGEIVKREATALGDGERIQLKVGNRDLYGMDFRWIDLDQVAEMKNPSDLVVLERQEYGNFYGYLSSIEAPGIEKPKEIGQVDYFRLVRENMSDQLEEVDEIAERISTISGRLNQTRLEMRKLEYQGVGPENPEYMDLTRRQMVLREDFEELVEKQRRVIAAMNRFQATFADVSGREKTMPLVEIVRLYQPNDMSIGSKILFYMSKIKELLVEDPRESNTEGGLFPAIFGTVMLVFVMSLFSFPLGVVAAIYLREYAKDGVVVRLVRIAVNNLAGIPSIVYGIFGLGFFVYGIGGAIDQLFFPERLPTPTFGTGGILWASLTLALLTVPVVIVATDEALGAIPAGVRDGSLALGATKFQTLVRILIPLASPGIMTGLILAMARAAGEVAPLMITGVVKLAPSLPLDGDFPFLHLDRKFMHLGFHIYDIGFQSPNVEAAKPMVFVTTLLLVLIVLVMSSFAIYLRNKMKKRYTYSAF